MNESEFEIELRQLKPIAPSTDLAKKIAAEFEAAGSLAATAPRSLNHTATAGTIVRPRRSILGELIRGVFWAGAGAAAMAVFLLNRVEDRPRVAVAGSEVAAMPAEDAVANAGAEQSESELIAAADEGVYVANDLDEPQRKMRLTYLERHIWTNPQTGAVIEFEVPREDIVLMPVAMQ